MSGPLSVELAPKALIVLILLNGKRLNVLTITALPPISQYHPGNFSTFKAVRDSYEMEPYCEKIHSFLPLIMHIAARI